MNYKVLIVDDDPRNIFALRLTLKARGYQVDSCPMAHEAIELLKKNQKFDVILMDMMMPELDGYQAIKIIKDTPSLKNIPIIAVTAQAMPEDRQKCLDAGASNYISKPINVDILLNLLKNI